MSDLELQLDLGRLSPDAMVALATRSSMRALAVDFKLLAALPPVGKVIAAHECHLLGLFVSTNLGSTPIAWARRLLNEFSRDSRFFELNGALPLLEATTRL
jgi:hypothetical protein